MASLSVFLAILVVLAAVAAAAIAAAVLGAWLAYQILARSHLNGRQPPNWLDPADPGPF